MTAIGRDILLTPRALVAGARTKAGSLVLAAVAAALCGLFVNAHGYVVLCGIVAALLLGLLWPWLSLRAVSAALSFEHARGREGKPLRLCLTIHNRWPLPVWGISVQPAQVAGDISTAIPLVNVAARQSTRSSCEFTPRCRGEYPRSTLYLVCGFPFGLWHPRKPVRVERSVLVWPKTVPVGPLPDAGGQWDGEGSGARGRPGSGDDLLGVRDYRRGDRLRLVHWGQTARQGRLFVRELQAASRPRVRIIVDDDAAAYDDLTPEGPREWAIRIAASLFVGWLEQGASVGMTIGDRSYPVSSSSPEHLGRVLDALARIPDLKEGRSSQVVRRESYPSRKELEIVIASERSKCALRRSQRSTGTSRFIVLPSAWSAGKAHGTVNDSARTCSWLLIHDAEEVESQLTLR